MGWRRAGPGQLRTFRFVEIREAGVESFSGVARELTCMGISTPRGLDKWNPMQVKRTEARAKSLGLPSAIINT